MKEIILNTVKISAAAILAILSAQALKLDFAVSAGIVAILSVQPTKKETLRTALARLLAFAAALAISATLFNLFGFSVKIFFVYLAVFIFICQRFKWISAMAMDSVLISHFLTFGKTGFTEVKNEVLLFALGVGFGIFVNIFLHKKTDYIEELKSKTDTQIKLVLERMSQRILNPALENYDGTCFDILSRCIFAAKKQADENYNNQFGKKDTYDTLYIAMRESQTKILYEMFKLVRSIKTIPSTAALLSAFLAKVSLEFHKDNDVKSLLQELSELRAKMKTVPLPVSRDEFEDRANLFILMERLQDFLEIKHNFMLSNNNRM